ERSHRLQWMVLHSTGLTTENRFSPGRLAAARYKDIKRRLNATPRRRSSMRWDMMRAMIAKAILLAAGRGRRLGEITATTPKPLIEVAGRPIIARIVENLAAWAVCDIAVVVGYLGELTEKWCTDFSRSRPDLRFTICRQSELNGTAGALIAAEAFAVGYANF